MGKLQGTRNSHFVASKIPKLRLIFSWEKKRGRRGRGTTEFQAYSPNEKYHFRKIEFRAFKNKNKRKAKNREWKNNILYIYE